jgi:hypothetical protein
MYFKFMRGGFIRGEILSGQISIISEQKGSSSVTILLKIAHQVRRFREVVFKFKFIKS